MKLNTRRPPRGRTLLILIVVWMISAVYVTANLNRGWIPHDEGTYAQSAERVLHGELPHRDFDDHYTGGLSFLNALAFHILGTNLTSLRIVLFMFFLAWVPALFYIATRFASDIASGAITLLAVAWSIPNYSAAVPSWYNLSFALFGAVAILRYIETRSSLWVFFAGLCGGLSILIKITGMYFVAAVLLFFVFREQCQADETSKDAAGGGRIYSLFLTAALLSFIAVLSALIRSFHSEAYIVQFVLPGAALVALLLWREFQKPRGNDGRRFLSLFRMLIPFGFGILLPIAVYLVPYIRSHSLVSLFKGVFILPQLHLQFTVVRLPGFSGIVPTLLLAGVIALAMCLRRDVRDVLGAVVAVVCVVLLVESAREEIIYRFVWNSLSFSIPLTVLAGVALLRRKGDIDERSALFRQQLMLLLCITALWTLVQIPFTAPIYFCFVAPMLALAMLALFSARGRAPRFILGTLLCFYLLFAVLRTAPGFIYKLGYNYSPDMQTTPFTLPRTGALRIEADDALLYGRLIPLMQEHAAGKYAYAAPDCPEVYFLSGLRNPTRTLFDYFDDPDRRTTRILSAIEQNRVNVVAILNKPPFSLPLAPDLRAALAERFPNSSIVGRFEVRWRQ
jgi:hypothetical protein